MEACTTSVSSIYASVSYTRNNLRKWVTSSLFKTETWTKLVLTRSSYSSSSYSSSPVSSVLLKSPSSSTILCLSVKSFNLKLKERHYHKFALPRSQLRCVIDKWGVGGGWRYVKGKPVWNVHKQGFKMETIYWCSGCMR